MPWEECTLVSLRVEFVERAMAQGANIAALCREYGISRKTGYKWLDRAASGDPDWAENRSRRPASSPNQTDPGTEQIIVNEREDHPTWGPRKLRASLIRKGQENLPCPSTISQILKRHGLIDPGETPKHTAFESFEMEEPNQLWQMDYKGQFELLSGVYCYPLTIIDDCSRFVVGLRACQNQKRATVVAALTSVFREYGLPDRMLMDNGPPWGNSREARYTVLTVWLLRLGIASSHGRPFHPQTQGKVERFHRTLNQELIKAQSFVDLEESQIAFDRWLNMYNTQRPHEAHKQEVPSEHYRPSSRPFPETLPPVDYDTGDTRKVDQAGKISYKNKPYRIGKAFAGQYINLRECGDGQYEIFYCRECIRTLDLRTGTGQNV